MKVPLSWIKEYLELSLSSEELAHSLTLAGLEVEGILSDPEPLFEIALTPNLGHCMSVYGVARELSAILNLPLKLLSIPLRESAPPIQEQIRISLTDTKQCFRYACRLVKGVQVSPSPEWMRKRLEASGVRSVNNVVDVGNYVMLALGQPLHLFDYDAIQGHHLRIVSHTSCPQIETLDGITRDIPPSALLICDEAHPLAFAGIMGASRGAVSDTTQTILIEAATFNPSAIRKTSKILGLRTESSLRFEKGTDPESVLRALDLAASLLAQIAGGQISQGVMDLSSHPVKPKKIQCRIERVNGLLGTQLSFSEIEAIFHRLQFKTLTEELHSLTVEVPSYRNDITSEIDLIEEVARIYGYHAIPRVTPVHIDSRIPHDPMFLFEKAMRERLLREGLRECVTCNLISPELAAWDLPPYHHGSDRLIAVMHPASADQSILRASLFPGLLQTVKYNIDHSNFHLQGFEIGRVHFKEKDQFQERSVAGILLTGRNAPYHWDPKPRDSDFFDLKGMIENLLPEMALSTVPSHLHYFHPGRQAYLRVGEITIGSLGEVHPHYTESLKIEQRVYFAELYLDLLQTLLPPLNAVAELPQFPGSERDWTLTVADQAPIASLLQLIQRHAPPILERVSLLDLYKSKQIGEDRKNVTFRFYYRDSKKTIELETVEKAHVHLIEIVTKEILA